jgi:serine/threonine protein phosphatase PrpC
MTNQATIATRIIPNAPSWNDKAKPLRVRSCGMTDRGLVRKNNEDQFLVAELSKAMRVCQSSLHQPKTQFSYELGHLFLVADGMGGAQAGEQASALAMETIEAFTLNHLKWFFHLQSDENHLVGEFQDALRQADARIIEEASRRPELHGMGTTVTMAYILDRELFVVHVGDSRCYLFRKGTLHQITHDHTILDQLLATGVITPEQAPRHFLRHVITNVVGGEKPGLDVEVHKLELEPEDVVLLCSDGLTEMLSAKQIADILGNEADSQRACQKLIEEANRLGGKDNVTVIVSRFEMPASAADVQAPPPDLAEDPSTASNDS